ncbi:LPS export ABC transporter periplasmic protein LptC [Thiolapillus sp.]
MRIWLLLALLVVLGFTWWASQKGAATSGQESVDQNRVQDYFVHGLELKLFDTQGKLSHVLDASRLSHYQASGITRLQQPGYLLYEDKQPAWTIRAENGQVSKDQSLLQLLGKTDIHWQGDEQRPPMHLLTSNLNIHPQQEYAETAAPVTVTSGENWIESTGMQAWLKTPGKIRFLAQTRAHYVAQ